MTTLEAYKCRKNHECRNAEGAYNAAARQRRGHGEDHKADEHINENDPLIPKPRCQCSPHERSPYKYQCGVEQKFRRRNADAFNVFFHKTLQKQLLS